MDTPLRHFLEIPYEQLEEMNSRPRPTAWPARIPAGSARPG